MKKIYKTPIFTPSSAAILNLLSTAIIKNIRIIPANIAIDIENPKVDRSVTLISKFTSTLKAQGIAGHNEILHIPI